MIRCSTLGLLIIHLFGVIGFLNISFDKLAYSKEPNKTRKSQTRRLPLKPITLNSNAKQNKTRGGCLVIPFAPYMESAESDQDTSIIIKTNLPSPKIWIYVRALEGLTNQQETKTNRTTNRTLSISYSAPDGKSVSTDSRDITFKHLPDEKVYESRIESFTLPINSKPSELEIDKPYEITISCGSLGNEKTVIIQRTANTETIDKTLPVIDRIAKLAESNLWLETVNTLIGSSKCKPSETIADWLEELANNKLPILDESEKIMSTFRRQFIENCEPDKGKS
jgi:hypothetical protein